MSHDHQSTRLHQGAGRDRCRGRRGHPAAGNGARATGAAQGQRRHPLGQGAVPVLRRGLRRARRHPERPRGRHSGRPGFAGEQGPQLRQGLLPVEDHVRKRPADDAAAAQEERRLRQGGRVHPGIVERGLRRDGGEVEGGARRQGPDGGRDVRLRPMDDLGGLRRVEALQGRLPQQQPRSERAPLHGECGRGLHAQLRHRRTHGLLRRHRAGRRVRALGLEHGRDAPDPVVAARRSAAHRAARQGRRAVDVRASQLRPRRPADRVHAAGGHGDPQFHLPLHDLEGQGQQRVREEERQFHEGRHRHRLRPSAQSSRREGPGEQRLSRRRRQSGRRSRQGGADQLRAVRQVRRRVRRRKDVEDLRRGGPRPRGARRNLRRPEAQGGVVLDHGLQPAHARHLGEQHDYNVHLLAGKISEPGNGPFSLTGQPSACGTAREVGTFSHRLPADMGRHEPGRTDVSPRPSGSCPRARFPTRSASMPWRRAGC